MAISNDTPMPSDWVVRRVFDIFRECAERGYPMCYPHALKSRNGKTYVFDYNNEKIIREYTGGLPCPDMMPEECEQQVRDFLEAQGKPYEVSDCFPSEEGGNT